VRVATVALCLALGGCASAEATRTAQDSLIINSSAAPACGSLGAARVAAKQASIETIKAGYDSYIITDQQEHTIYSWGALSSFAYPEQGLKVKMFHKGDPDSENALDARTELGPDWQKIVTQGQVSCL
jgi:hypothetical protein